MKKMFFITLTCLLFIISGMNRQLYSQSSTELNKRGVELGEKRKYDEAIRYFDRVIRRNDRLKAMALHNKGWALEKQRKRDEAIENYEQAWRISRKHKETGERLGYLYYKKEKYRDAIEVGEQVLDIDPENKEVPPWLEKAKRRLRKLERKKAEKKKQPVDYDKRDPYIVATIDGSIRFGYYNGPVKKLYGLYSRKPNTVKFINDRGFAFDSPYSVNLWIKPIKYFEIYTLVENPYLGALSPNFIKQQEIAEGLFHLGPLSLGAGVMFTHLEGSGVTTFFRDMDAMDIKLGFIVGYKSETFTFKLSVYPRYIIRDKSSKSGLTLDAVNIRLDSRFKLADMLSLYPVFHVRDYFIVWHKMKSANYRGVFDLGIGVTYTEKNKSGNFEIGVSLEWIQRFYFRKMYDSPYTFRPNGTGWFGLDLDWWDKRSPFSGFWTISQVLSLKVEEHIGNHFFLYQKFSFEIAGKQRDHQELLMQIGVGARY